MITSTYDWKINTKEPDAGFFKLAKEHGLAETAAKIAYERGVTTEEALEDFLKADLSYLHDPYLLHDMDKAVERIRRAIEDYEQILIYGDYDADGMTSASIMKETLGQRCKSTYPTALQTAMVPMRVSINTLSSSKAFP